MTDHTTRIKLLMAGICSVILAVGVARFAYTPLLPLMQQQAGLGVAAAGWLAAINYAGVRQNSGCSPTPSQSICGGYPQCLAIWRKA